MVSVITKKNDTLIFDEVMTGFRLAYGGAQEHFGITPDLTTLGKIKIIGGGLPVGSVWREKGDYADGSSSWTYVPGWYSEREPIGKTLKRLQEPGTYEYLDKVTGTLIKGIVDAGKKAGHEICSGCISGMFGFFFAEGSVFNFEDAKKCDTTKFARFHKAMLEEGVYLAPSQFEAGFTSLTHTAEDIQWIIAAAEKAFQRI